MYKVGNGSNMVGISLIVEFYEQIVWEGSQNKWVNVKTEKKIISKIKTLKSKDTFFQKKLLLEQITVNC